MAYERNVLTKLPDVIERVMAITRTKENMVHVVRVSHGRSSSKINIPVDLAKVTGIDRSEHVVVMRKGEDKLEVKRYDGSESLKEYFSGDRPGSDRSSGGNSQAGD